MSSHQNYLESPYSARDTEVAMQEHWEENEASAEYEFLVETDNIDGIMDDEDNFTPIPFDEWLQTPQAESAFENWANYMLYGE